MATINGTKFDDRITGTFLNDVINGLDGNDNLDGGSGHDQLDGGGGDDVMIGGRGFDTLTGGTGDDILEGGADADTMTGGLGDDIYVVDNVGDLVSEGKNEGLDRVYARISTTLPSNIEILVLDDVPGALNGTGNGLDNIIWGNSLDNTLSGGAGDDHVLGWDGADLLIGGAGDDALWGGIDDDTMMGGASDDFLDGWTGLDTMIGGAGNDTYVVYEAGDVVTENSNEGIDEVLSNVDYVLGANVENLTLGYTAELGTGNALDNVIVGNSVDNVLDGGAGNDMLGPDWSFLRSTDTLIGGSGNDTFYAWASDTVVERINEGVDRVVAFESYTLPWHVENLEFQVFGPQDVDGAGNNLDNLIHGTEGINILSGRDGDDRLYGRGGADVLVGGNDNDTLDGGAGADVMVGGDGDDGYWIDDAGDVVTESANEGTDSVDSWTSYALGAHVENLGLRGDADLDGTGNVLDNLIMGNDGVNVLTGGAGNDSIGGESGNDTIYGNEGNDLLDGQRDADTMTGGVGDDTYFIDNAGDIVVELAGEGADLAYCRASHTLAAHVENLTLDRFSGAINGTGNSLVNLMTGNDDENVLSGMAGDDTLIGGAGIDQLIGGAGNDTMEGGLGNDILDGGISNDTFIGGAGVDLLTGGNGVDRFQFNAASDGADVIADFVTGTDRIWLDDAGFGLAGTGTLAATGVAFVQGAAAASASATVLFNAATHQLLWDADGSGAGPAQLLATLVGVNQMSASDFMIV